MVTYMSRKWRLPLGKLRVLSGKEVCAIVAKHGFVEVRRLNLSVRHSAERGRLIGVIDPRIAIDRCGKLQKKMITLAGCVL
jgi:hypothetical protein